MIKWYSLVVAVVLGLTVLFVFFFEFSDSGARGTLFGVSGTMLAIIAAVAIFVHQAVGERGSYWASRLIDLREDLSKSASPDELAEHMRSPGGPIHAGTELLIDLERVASGVGTAAALLAVSLIAGALGVFGPRFTFCWQNQAWTREQIFGSLALASMLLAATIIAVFVVLATRAGLIRRLRTTLDQVKPRPDG